MTLGLAALESAAVALVGLLGWTGSAAPTNSLSILGGTPCWCQFVAASSLHGYPLKRLEFLIKSMVTKTHFLLLWLL